MDGILAGFVAALVSGLVAIRFLLRYLRTNTLRVFVGYRIVLAILAVVVIAWR